MHANEGCNVGICNFSGTFISTDRDKSVKRALRGRLAELMANIASKIYRQHVIYERGRRVLYVIL